MEVLQVLARVPFLYIVDIILAKRVEFAYEFKNAFTHRSHDHGFLVPKVFENDWIFDNSVTLLISLVYFIALIGCLAPPTGIILSYLLIASLCVIVYGYQAIVWTINGIFTPSSLIRRQTYDFIIIASIFWLIICMLSYWVWMLKRFRETRLTRRRLYAFPFCLLGICMLFMSFLLAEMMQRSCNIQADRSFPLREGAGSSNPFRILVYTHSKEFKQLMHEYTSQVCVDATNVAQSLNSSYRSFPFLPYTCVLNYRPWAWVFSRCCSVFTQYFPYVWLVISMFLVFYKLVYQVIWPKFMFRLAMEQQRFIQLQIPDFTAYHWKRIQIQRLFIYFWIIKTASVVLQGPDSWPLNSLLLIKSDPVKYSDAMVKSIRGNFPAMLNLSNHPNMLLFSEYLSSRRLWQDTLTGTFESFFVRFGTALFVHGTETWWSFLATASCLGYSFSKCLKLAVWLGHSSGHFAHRMEQVIQDPRVEVDVWNAVENIEIGNLRYHHVAAEMINGANLFCVIPMVVLGVQYDLPQLCLTDRVYAFLHGFILVVIMSLYCLEAVMRSGLIELTVNHVERANESWPLRLSRHIHQLVVVGCLALITILVLVELPASPVLFDPISVQEPSKNMNAAEEAAYEIMFAGRRGLFSVTSLFARRIKLVLCGVQLLINIISMLADYGGHIYKSYRTDWNGFERYIYWTRLTTAVADYIFSTISFLMILWLSIFDSFGLFRTIIMLAYLYFVLYPTAHRGYTWIRWRLFFAIRIMGMRNPTQRELEAEGDNCSICYEAMSPETSKVTPCGHYFHLECLTTWMKRTATCPMCQSDLLSKNVRNMRKIKYDEQPEDVPVELIPSTPTTSASVN